MKFQKAYIFIFIIVFFTSNAFGQKKQLVDSKLVLADLIKTTVMLVDTSSIEFLSQQYGRLASLQEHKISTNLMYLETSKFNLLLNHLKKIANNRSAVISIDGSDKSPTSEEIIKSYTHCYMVECEEFDKDGNSNMEPKLMCDDYTKIEKTIAIEFYEKWNFNTQNGMIEKEVIAYTPLSLKNNDYILPLFTVYKNKSYIKLISESSY